eukprot:CAMPEP_0168390878 /NCGR_PEP_ID=MMETSP0228-20121227/17700_1 /TAXON_ID=133427 /ORGANISM="Protoceratium reticulatum, Strain CCCM 535 (=CCMP 1889)" /LENGTH=38 /DNA_ID= /DNA_START= /DNA_END= /DNA_ORIENTATION=
MARSTLTVLASLLLATTAAPADDRNAMLQGKLQLMGMA